MKVLFINPVPERCGVHQYGLRLYSILVNSVRLHASYSTTDTCDTHGIPDVVIYNWHPLIDPPCEVIQRARFNGCKKVIAYHDGHVTATVDRVIYSNPCENSHTTWSMIGRPLPEWIPFSQPASDKLVVGIAGFCGGWGADAVRYICSQYPAVHFRMLLPFSYWCDPHGASAQGMAAHCRAQLRPEDTLDVEHNFLAEQDMLAWLATNHVNCYIRDASPSMGTSSALDNALAVRRPIAINRNHMFRYLFDLKPSICIEDTPMRDIVQNGVAPLIPVYERNDRKVVLGELEQVLLSL